MVKSSYEASKLLLTLNRDLEGKKLFKLVDDFKLCLHIEKTGVCKCKRAVVTNEGKKLHTKWFTH